MMRRVAGAAVLALALALPVVANFRGADSELRIAKSEIFRGVEPCRWEDGSGQSRCVWDAEHRGNGVGRSLVVTRVGERETFVYVSHARAHRLVSAWRAARCAP